ncbi:hypothetical protein IQ268_04490 [Oculatella sp. LEGE 06141]|uniref:hypothetical protein n=1 Tax=Oculatella sp. LEGE 06141 TaxID=1828648 RepID=UPI00187E12AC|nr:hypothetical protein [Oculatella sp. LEGE 06141]MBE9177840.1 hypothetical protein [Oculatella sp. LEGE 06141]
MRRISNKSEIRPKISTMPRPQTEASAFLDIYKLVVEQKRLQEELHQLDQRRNQICKRMALLDQQVANLEHTVQTIRQTEANRPTNAETPGSFLPSVPENFETLFLEY